MSTTIDGDAAASEAAVCKAADASTLQSLAFASARVGWPNWEAGIESGIGRERRRREVN